MRLRRRDLSLVEVADPIGAMIEQVHGPMGVLGARDMLNAQRCRVRDEQVRLDAMERRVKAIERNAGVRARWGARWIRFFR